MCAQILSGPGVGLPPPVQLYPQILGAGYPAAQGDNFFGLGPGDAVEIPATGSNGWLVDTGAVSLIQWLDPVTGIWRTQQRLAVGPQFVTSDGFTRRVANLTGCPIGAVVTGGGSGFAQSTATITANIGGSTWQAVVGGALSISTIANPGANYTMPPIVHIPFPGISGQSAAGSPGIQATAYAAITSGTVSSVSLQDFGAGYASAPAAVIIPNPADPNYGSITNATITLVLNAALAATITGALCTNNGAALASASLGSLTLTAAGGAGSGATLAGVVMQTIASATTSGGAGWGVVASPPTITTGGGNYIGAASANANPMVEMSKFRPRPAIINTTSSAGGVMSSPVIIDPGLFVSTPTALIIPGLTSTAFTAATVTFGMGTFQDTILMQPL